MKKPDNHNRRNPAIVAKVTLTDPGILFFLVEMLANRRSNVGSGPLKIAASFQTSSIEGPVTGNTTLNHTSGVINTNFATRFLFTCTKVKGLDYCYTWLCSLS